MSDDHSTTPWRCPPAHTPRVSSSGACPSATTGSENVCSQELTQSCEKALAGPYEVS